MSRMEIYGVKPDGDIERVCELQNAWLGAMLVWTELGNKYLGPFNIEAECARREMLRQMGRDAGPFDPMGVTRSWRLHRSRLLTDAEWCVLKSTFDGCIVGNVHFSYVAQCFRQFGAQFPKSHYTECARVLDEMGDHIGYCVNATSVNDNPWWVRVADEDEGRPYNVNIDHGHWWFDPEDRMREIEKEEAVK